MPSRASAICAKAYSACITQCLCCKWLCHTQRPYSASVSATQSERKNAVETLVHHLGDNVASTVIVYTGDCMPAISASANSVPAS